MIMCCINQKADESELIIIMALYAVLIKLKSLLLVRTRNHFTKRDLPHHITSCALLFGGGGRGDDDAAAACAGLWMVVDCATNHNGSITAIEFTSLAFEYRIIYY